MEQFLPLIINITLFIKTNGAARPINEFGMRGYLSCRIIKSRRRSCLQSEDHSSISFSSMAMADSSFFRHLIAPELVLLIQLSQV